jgi:NDP-sugar pyrophosphorylase family protein
MYHATDFMNDVIASGKKLIHFPIRGYWLDIGKHNDFEKAQKDVLHINWE